MTTPTTKAVQEALAEAPSPEAQERHIEAIYREAVNERLDNQAEEIDDLRRTVAGVRDAFAARLFEVAEQVRILTGQVQELRESQKEAERDEYVNLRRALLVIGLTDVLSGWHHPDWFDDDRRRAAACSEFYRRYGHLTAGGRPLWSKPPEKISDKTKAEIAKALKIRAGGVT